MTTSAGCQLRQLLDDPRWRLLVGWLVADVCRSVRQPRLPRMTGGTVGERTCWQHVSPRQLTPSICLSACLSCAWITCPVSSSSVSQCYLPHTHTHTHTHILSEAGSLNAILPAHQIRWVSDWVIDWEGNFSSRASSVVEARQKRNLAQG